MVSYGFLPLISHDTSLRKPIVNGGPQKPNLAGAGAIGIGITSRPLEAKTSLNDRKRGRHIWIYTVMTLYQLEVLRKPHRNNMLFIPLK